MVVALVRGSDIEFPDLYQEKQFEGRFAYVHNGNPVVLRVSDYDIWLKS
jgi:hypothetical protein